MCPVQCLQNPSKNIFCSKCLHNKRNILFDFWHIDVILVTFISEPLFSKETGQLFTYFTEILPYDIANYNVFTLAKKVLFQISFQDFLICIQVKVISFIVVVFYSFLFPNYFLYCLTTIVSWSTGHFKWPCATFSWH